MKPETFVQRTYGGIAGFSPQCEMLRMLDQDPDNPLTLDILKLRFEQQYQPPHDTLEYLVCSHVDEHGCNVVFRSSSEFGEALDALRGCAPGHYMVAIQP